jgi:hypothetical protein
LCQYKKKKYYIAVVDGMELKIIKWDGILWYNSHKNVHEKS